MHVDEVKTDVSLVSRLLAAQFPQWADLPLRTVDSAGTDNALYRLGDDMVVRLPRIHWATGQIDTEHRWLPRLAPHLPLAIPAQLARGNPGEGYPWHWSIYRWIEGETMTIDSRGGPPADPYGPARGTPLAMRDTPTRKAISALQGILDNDAVTAAWEAALQAPEWNDAPVWFHGDMLPGNLLFERGRLKAVIDFGALGVGDPACDLMIAWNLFSGESRDVFRAALAVDDATWARGRGWALSQALIFIPYYLKSNPVGVGYARRAIAEALADFGANR
jgi:aminoglycoside phosphotransferase (APT) family kinase protein